MLQDDLRTQFLPHFLSVARQRLEQAKTLSFSKVAGELHALAGEAMLLGLPEVFQLAADAEAAAQRCFENADPAARATCAQALARLTELVDALADKPPPQR
jgi:HPt (histidine-containing phosphotransfer) domain-containing protein